MIDFFLSILSSGSSAFLLAGFIGTLKDLS